MGLQERILVCGTYWTIVGMGLRFLLGPALFAAASLLVGLRGVSLHVSIVQVLQTHYPTSLVARSIYRRQISSKDKWYLSTGLGTCVIFCIFSHYIVFLCQLMLNAIDLRKAWIETF
jgi:hypothetical protein